MGYGYDAKGLDDRNVNNARNIVQFASERALPGALLVNDLPFCKRSFVVNKVRRSFSLVRYIPEWLPWISYKPLARYGYDIGQAVLHGPLDFVRETIVSV